MSDDIKDITQLRDIPPRTKDELQAYLLFFYDIHLAAIPIEEGNSTPMDFAWHIYSVAMGFKEDVSMADYNILGMACRGGQKSLTCASVELLLMTFDQDRDYFHMASIYEQSRVTYRYVQTVLNKFIMKGVVLSSTMRETISRYDRQLKIGTGTIRNVNSMHGSVIQDEVDLTDRNVFVESKGMLSPGKNGKSPLDVKISSRKYAFGNIQALLDAVARDPDYPLTIHKWGQLEITERCSDERSGGTEKTITIWIDKSNLKAISDTQYDNIQYDDVRAKFRRMKGFPNCLDCGIFSFCKGNLKKQTTENKFLTPIDDVKRYFRTDDREFFKAQRLNEKPSQSGLILPDWDPSIHQFATYAVIYDRFSKEKWAKEDDITLFDIIRFLLAMGARLYVGVDFGFNVGVALLICKLGEQYFILDQVVGEGQSDASLAKMAWDKWQKYPITRGYGDVASPGGVLEFANYFPMLEPVFSGHKNKDYKAYAILSKNYDYKFGLTRKLLKSPEGDVVSIYVYAGVTEIVDYAHIYRYALAPDGTAYNYPADGQRDHGIDAMLHGLVGVTIAGAGNPAMVIADTSHKSEGDFVTAPTPDDVARILGNSRFNESPVDMPVRSGPIDPHTGLSLESVIQKESDKKPRGAAGFKCTFV